MMSANLMAEGGGMEYVLTETWPLTLFARVTKGQDRLASMRAERDVEWHGPYIVIGGDGMKAYTIYEFRHMAKASEVHSEILKSLKGNFSIPGYKASLEMAITHEEALNLFGRG
jgi:hypothetical protein